MRHNLRSAALPCHAPRITSPPSSPMPFIWRSRVVKGLLKRYENRTTEQSANLRQNLAYPDTSHINMHTKRHTYHFGSTSAMALPPSTPMLFHRRLRVVKALLKNREIEKIARTTRSGTFLGQYGSVGRETCANRKLLTCLAELPPELPRPLYRSCCSRDSSLPARC